MSMKEDLEKLILDSYHILRQNDRQILVADPREKFRLQKENSESWGYIQDYLSDYASLCEFLQQSALEDIVHIAATRFPEVATRLVVASRKKSTQSSTVFALTQPSKSDDLQFEIDYKFVQPYAPMSQEKMVQFLVSFSCHGNVSLSQTDVVTHVCLVLDVSGSMDAPDKYPYLLTAIPYIVDALPDKDWLTIILFSDQSELVWTKDIASSRMSKQDIHRRITQSEVKFSGTQLYPGLQTAIAKIKQFNQSHPGAVNRLYMLTDGQLSDAATCYRLNPELRQLEVEVNSYGFGQDFAEETMRQIMEGCRGARVKQVSDTDSLWRSFHHIGEVAQNIVATNADLELTFSPSVTPADAFRFEPGRYWFGSVDDQSKRFYMHIGALEKERVYKYAFEARVYPSMSRQEPIASAILKYSFQGKQQAIEQSVLMERSSSFEQNEQVNKDIEDVFLSLEELRSNDPEKKKRSLQARIKILRDQGGDPAQIQLLEKALQQLLQAGTLEDLSEQEMRYLRADGRTTHA